MLNNSCIYIGNVIHKRFKPKEHFFKYKVFSLFIDLYELKEIEKKIKFFSYNKFNLISFFDIDHGARDGTSLEDWVKKHLKNVGVLDTNIKIRLLCYPRILGYVFNPLSIFFIYDENNNLISILYEVKNTFNEQHTYVFKTEKGKNLIENSCNKKFHVSPFIEMECKYFFKILNPDNNLSVIINQSDNEGKLLYASQDGIKKKLNNKNLIFSYISHPLMTFKIIGAIHYEALKLWLKGIKLVKKKLKIKNNISFEAK
tara:strand:+ start:19 stop:789 length:771 start_codon:yes stop_codon:yes gene_type:complete